jgi:hypothetical protein
MRRVLGPGLVLALLTASAPAVRADPSAPQINPVHLQREDAQRLRDLQRTLDRDQPAPAVATRPLPPAPVSTDRHSARVAGIVTVSIAGGVGFVALSWAAYNAAIPAELNNGESGIGTAPTVLLVGAAIAGAVGIGLLISSRAPSAPASSSVRLGPLAAPHAAGLAITGRL